MVDRKSNDADNAKTKKAKTKKAKTGLLHGVSKREKPTDYINEMHPTPAPNSLTDDAVIKERVIEINTADLTSIASAIETGKLLNELDEEIDHGKWLPLFKGYKGDNPAEVQFRFGERKAQMLMTIAKDPFVSNPQNYADLPLSWTAVYDAVKKIPHELPRLFATNQINGETTHEKIKEVIARVEGTCNFTHLVNHVIGIVPFMQACPETFPLAMIEAFFEKKGNSLKVDDEDFADMPAWLAKLCAKVCETVVDDDDDQHDADDDDDDQHDADAD